MWSSEGESKMHFHQLISISHWNVYWNLHSWNGLYCCGRRAGIQQFWSSTLWISGNIWRIQRKTSALWCHDAKAMLSEQLSFLGQSPNPLADTTCLRNLTDVLKNWQFSGESFKSNSLNLCRTRSNWSSCSSSVADKTIILLRKTKASLKFIPCIHFSINLWKVLGFFVTPCSILLNSQNPISVTKAVLHVSSSSISTSIARLEVHNWEPLWPCQDWEGFFYVGQIIYILEG